jgi:hypothetical protein
MPIRPHLLLPRCVVGENGATSQYAIAERSRGESDLGATGVSTLLVRRESGEAAEPLCES